MRILPFGDGIVLGEGASGGFRTPLEELLLSTGIEFEFVGRNTDNSFEMRYPNHEGWARADVAFLREDCLESAIQLAPELILLYAGAEDIRMLPNAGIAVARLEKLIMSLLADLPDCKILTSQLIPNRDHAAEQKVKAFNQGLGNLVETLSSKGRSVSRLKMHARVKPEHRNEAGLPNEQAYATMAEVWFQGIVGTLQIAPS
jgi:hypothetical protein